MKKAISAICLVLVFSLLLSPLCMAAEGNYDTLADWEIKIAVPDNATAVLKGNEYYIYAQRVGSIPYVLLKTYKAESEQQFLTDFIAALQKERADLEVSSEIEMTAMGDKICYEVDYNYSISGNKIFVRLAAIKVGERVYAFLSKEVPARNMTVGTMLEDVIANCEFLGVQKDEREGGLDELEEQISVYPAYLYCQKDGMPKYWMDFSGTIADAAVLHCYFRSGDPTFYEKTFLLYLDTAEFSKGRIEIHDIMDSRGYDVTDWFESMTLVFKGNKLEMQVKRNESTLAGGSEDNILTGKYPMTPMNCAALYKYYQDDGQLKYWLDLNGDNIELHAMFRSDSPEYYEKVFILDNKGAEESEHSIRIKKVYTEEGYDVSNWFRILMLTEVEGAIMMNVRRDESTLAGGADDNILTGVYLLEPSTYLLPGFEGKISLADLGHWAQIYYFIRNGYYPPKVDVKKNGDGTFSIHLYEVVRQDGQTHTATSAWYTVDKYGVGVNDITGAKVDLLH